MTQNSPYCVITTTVSQSADAEQIIEKLLMRRLAACVQQSKITSQYRWNNGIEKDEEIRLDIKTRTALIPEIKKCILDSHPYDTPELVVLPIMDGHQEYLEWINAETEPD